MKAFAKSPAGHRTPAAVRLRSLDRPRQPPLPGGAAAENGADDGNRTRTIRDRGILSPLRLPIPPRPQASPFQTPDAGRQVVFSATSECGNQTSWRGGTGVITELCALQALLQYSSADQIRYGRRLSGPTHYPAQLGASAAPLKSQLRYWPVASRCRRGSELVAQIDADCVQLHILIAVGEITGRVIMLGAKIVVAILRADDELVGQRVIDAGAHGPADTRA